MEERNKIHNICEMDKNDRKTTTKTDDSSDNQLNKIVVFSLKLLIIGLMAIYLLYEGIELIRLYNNYNTLVSVYYEHKDFNQIPSFTICLPTIIDRNKLLTKYPDLAQELNEAQNEENRKNIFTEYLDKAFDSMNWTELTIQEKETINCTLNYWAIKSRIYSIDYEKPIGLNCRDVDKPIESYSNNKAKCFTYFSQLNINNRFIGDYSLRNGVKNLNAIKEIINIEFILDFNNYMTLGFIENETTIAIHQQKMIANMEYETQVIEAGNQYDIIINKISTKLLEKPYKTMCYKYEKQNKINSRQQCIDNCVLQLYKDKCNCIPIQLTNTIQLLNTSSQTVCSLRDSSLRSNRCYDSIAREVGLCLTSGRCPQSCETIRYLFRTKTKALMTGFEEIEPNYGRKVVIKVVMDQSIGDTIETHVPLMSFGQLLAHICALIAIFSGLSFIGFANLIIDRMPSIRLMAQSRQVEHRDEESSGSGTNPTNLTKQQIQQKDKSWTENSKCSPQTDCITSCIGSPKRQLHIVSSKRPATSNIYDSTSSNVIDIKTQDK